MDSDILAQIRTLLELGFPAVMLVLNFMLWRELRGRIEAHVADLREVAGIRKSLAPALPNVNANLNENK